MHHGFPVRYYKKIRERNEALDCAVYAMAALDVLNPAFEKLAENMTKEVPVEELSDLVPATPKENRPAPRRRQAGGGFVDAWR